MKKDNDPVNNPSHYTDGNIEVIDFIEDKKLGFHLGNAVKYISRAGKKNPEKTEEDLKKAIWYINRHIQHSKKTEAFVSKRTKPQARVGDRIEWSFGPNESERFRNMSFAAEVATVNEEEQTYGVYASYGQDYIPFDQAIVK